MNTNSQDLFDAITLPGTPEPTHMWELLNQVTAPTVEIFYEVDGLVRIVYFKDKKYKLKLTQVK